jgi:hypothetical protein
VLYSRAKLKGHEARGGTLKRNATWFSQEQESTEIVLRFVSGHDLSRAERSENKGFSP